MADRFTTTTVEFEEWQRVLSDALLDGLRRATPFIRSITPTPDGRNPVNGIAYELAPWFGYLDISLRDESDEIPAYPRDSDSPGWKYSGILDEIGESEETTRARKLIRQVYERAEGMDAARTAHLLFIAAARALLDPEVVRVLSSAGISAWVLPDYFEIRPSRTRLEIGHFDFIVEDPDGTVRGNYCDLVLLERATRACFLLSPNHDRIT